MSAKRNPEFNAGEAEALILAIATLVRILPLPLKQTFLNAYAGNETYSESLSTSLPMSDDWQIGLTKTSVRLVKLIQM